MFACLSPSPLTWFFLYLNASLALLGAYLCLLGPASHKQLITRDKQHEASSKKGKKSNHNSIILIGVQIALILISLIFLCTIEQNARLNPRLQSLEMGFLLRILQQHIFTLGILPWLLYALIGIGLAYFSTVMDRIPTLSKSIIPRAVTKVQKFLHYFLYAVTEAVNVLPIIFILSMIILGLTESVQQFLDGDLLVKNPLRAGLTAVALVVIFRPFNGYVIKLMKKYQISVGLILIGYAFVFSILFIAIYWSMGTIWLSKLSMYETYKSRMNGFFSEADLLNRHTLLIWGWWSIWIPFMASVVARVSIGLKIRYAFLQAIFLPILIFGGLTLLSITHWEALCLGLQRPQIQTAVTLFLCLCMGLAWGNVHNTADVSYGLMLRLGRLKKYPLTKWMLAVILWTICFLPSWFMSGWIPSQIILTIAGGFMTAIMLVFIGALVASLYRDEAVEKCKAQGIP